MSPTPRPGPGPKPAGPTHPTPTHPPRGNGHALPPLPRRGEQIRDAERLGAQMLAVLQRTCDPASDPSAEDDPTGLGYVAIRLMSARADVRSALSMLSQITDLDLPPAGSAVRIPGPPLTAASDEVDGPPSHLSEAERRSAVHITCGHVHQPGTDCPHGVAAVGFTLPVPPDWHWLNTK